MAAELAALLSNRTLLLEEASTSLVFLTRLLTRPTKNLQSQAILNACLNDGDRDGRPSHELRLMDMIKYKHASSHNVPPYPTEGKMRCSLLFSQSLRKKYMGGSASQSERKLDTDPLISTDSFVNTGGNINEQFLNLDLNSGSI